MNFTPKGKILCNAAGKDIRKRKKDVFPGLQYL